MYRLDELSNSQRYHYNECIAIRNENEDFELSKDLYSMSSFLP